MPKNAAASAKHQNKPRKVFYLILILLPFCLLALAECALRLSGYGQHYPLFIQAQGIKGYMQPNPDLIKRYFHLPKLAPNVSPDTVLFQQQKATDSFRIVIQGGSTAAGFPYGRFGSLTGMLQQRFKRLYPHRNIEIISTAMASINSYTLRDTVDEVIAIEPDLVLIYAGHNEYLGVMGVGSVYAGKGGHLSNLLFLKLKSVRLFQLIQRLYYGLFDSASEQMSQPQAGQSQTLMAKVAKEKNIPLNSDLYKSGVSQFSDNLRAILAAYQQANIPVVVSTLAANEAEQAPFESDDPGDIQTLKNLLDSGETEATLKLATTMLEKHPQSANLHYLFAKALQKQGNNSQALNHFIQASDLDLLRFRAPSEFNQIIRQQADINQALLVDTQALLRQKSSNGLIDKHLMFEHLHPNRLGYFLLAESFTQIIVQQQFIASSVPYLSEQQAWQDVPLTEVDQRYAEYKIASLTANYPFTTTPKAVPVLRDTDFVSATTLQRLKGKSWIQVQQDMLTHYQQQGNRAEAAKVAGILFDALPYKAQIADIARKLYTSVQDLSLAHYYAQKALAIEPNNTSLKLGLAESYYRLKRPHKAIAELTEILNLQPNHTQAKFYLEQINAAQ